MFYRRAVGGQAVCVIEVVIEAIEVKCSQVCGYEVFICKVNRYASMDHRSAAEQIRFLSQRGAIC